MTTPQSILSSLEYRIRRVCEMLEGDFGDDDAEGRCDLIERLSQIELQNDDLIVSNQRMENMMTLIIKLLSVNEKI